MICTIQEISKMLGGNIIFENLSLSIKQEIDLELLDETALERRLYLS